MDGSFIVTELRKEVTPEDKKLSPFSPQMVN